VGKYYRYLDTLRTRPPKLTKMLYKQIHIRREKKCSSCNASQAAVSKSYRPNLIQRLPVASHFVLGRRKSEQNGTFAFIFHTFEVAVALGSYTRFSLLVVPTGPILKSGPRANHRRLNLTPGQQLTCGGSKLHFKPPKADYLRSSRVAYPYGTTTKQHKNDWLPIVFVP